MKHPNPLETADILLEMLDTNNVIHFYACKALIDDLSFAIRLITNMGETHEQLSEIKQMYETLNKIEFFI